MEGYEISTDRARLDLLAIHAYLVRSYWSPGIPLEIVERAVLNSLCFGVYETASGAQVGFTRVVTDYATFAYLCDVYVLEEHRGRGLSKLMMREAMTHPALADARRVMLATRDAHGLYRHSGFVVAGAAGNLMEVVRPDIYLDRASTKTA
ncbi:MAG: GNAT family N-acetyltransferase [Pseudomonadota bacterium]